MKSIFLFELTYRLKRPATWIYALIFLALGILFLSTDAVRIGGGYGKVNSNAPNNIHQILCLVSTLALFVIMAFFAVPVFRDSDHKVDTFLYAYPIRKNDYLAGRFAGTFFMCGLVFLFLPLGMMIGETIARHTTSEPDNWGPFRLDSYAWPFLVSVLPNILLLGSLFFALVTLTRKMMHAYILAISFIVLYGATLNLLTDLESKVLASLLDPFGLTASGRITEYWSIAEKNERLVPLEGVYLWNRLIWSAVGLAVLGIAFLRFKMSPVSDSAKGSGRKAKQVSEEAAPIARPARMFEPDFAPLKTFYSLFVLETRQTLRNGIFLAMLFAIGGFLIGDEWYSDRSYDTGIHPVTGIMLESATDNMFTILSIALLVFLAGEIVWRERQSKIEGIYDAFPIPNAVIFWSKFASLMLVPLFLLMLVPITGIAIQAIKGYYHFELELYFKALLLFELPTLWLIAALAFSIQNIVNNKYTGNIAILGYYLSFIGLSYLKVEHPLFKYGSGMSYTYSDMNGFGDSVRSFPVYLLHWTLVALFLLSIAYLFLVRGPEGSLKARFTLARERLRRSGRTRLGILLPLAGMLGTGYYITYQTLVVDHYTNSKEDEKTSHEYEKKFSYLQRTLHPSLKASKIGADLYPENGDLDLRGDLVYYNPHKKAIDTLWFNVKPEGVLKAFDLSVANTLVYDDAKKGIRAYKLKQPLQPNDSFNLTFGMHMAFTGLSNESPVYGNGTFFNQSYWPSVGYNESYQIQDEDKRKEYGLPKLPTFPAQTDSNAISHSLFDYHNHSMTFECVVSTSPDQIAVAPGYLVKEWNDKGRRYFHYKMDRPITNFYSILSARYQVYKENWKGVEISIYHHPWHTFNLKKMVKSVRHSLEYYSKNFGPYQHRQVRILEFPRYSSFAQSFDNTIPYSEGIGFIADLNDEKAIDYVYFVTAHEMAHQWWGHQINPAFARGAQFLSETMAEYSALMVMKEQYGEKLMGRFLRRELNRYLNGRSNEKSKENPLMDVEMQNYAYYNKGSLAMYSVMDLLGETRMNEFLTGFVHKYKFAERPYPTTVDYYTALRPYIQPDHQELIDDQLKRITLYKNKIAEATGKKLADGTYEVRIKVELGKMYVDSLGGHEVNAKMRGPVTVGLLQAELPVHNHEVISIQKMELVNGQEVKLTSKVKPKYAGLDLLNALTDIFPEDNVKLIDWKD